MNQANWLVPFNADDVKAVHSGQETSRRTIMAVLTSQTCGENCWHAKEEICRCSCGGVNHGCLLVKGAEQPVRASRIDGAMYELAEVGVHDYEIDKRLRSEFPPMMIRAESIPQYCDKDLIGQKRIYFTSKSKNSPLRVKPATKEQLAKWPELKAFRDLPPYRLPVYLLWKLKSASSATP